MKSNKTRGSSADKKKSVWLVRMILAILIVAAGGAGAWYYLAKTAQAKSTAQAGASTSTATVQRGNITLTASGQGTLVATQTVNMSFSTSGKVAELNVRLGDMVKAGDVLARLENAEDLEAALATAQATLLEAQQALTTLQKSGSATLSKAYQDLVTAQATYNDALTANQRTAYARCSAEISARYKAALDKATQNLKALTEADRGTETWTIASYDYDTAAANSNYCASYSATEKTSASSTLEVAKSALEQAQAKYDTLKKASGIDPDTLSMDETKVETAQTMVDKAQETLNGITLKATIDGKITSLAASVGTIVDTSTFLTISDISKPTVTVNIDETDIDKLVVDNSAVVTFTALPGQTFTGKVSLASPAMIAFGPFKAASGEIELDGNAAKILENQPLGMSATINITGKQAKDVLVVPVTALKTLKTRGYAVMLVGSDGELTQQAVTVGLQDSSSAEISSGLKEGDVVSVTSTKSTNSSNSTGGNDGGMPGGGGMMP